MPTIEIVLTIKPGQKACAKRISCTQQGPHLIVSPDNLITTLASRSGHFRSSYEFVLTDLQQSPVAMEILKALNEALTMASYEPINNKVTLLAQLQKLLPLHRLLVGENNLPVCTDDSQILSLTPPDAGLFVFFSLHKLRMDDKLLAILRTLHPVPLYKDYFEYLTHTLTPTKFFNLLRFDPQRKLPPPKSDNTTKKKRSPRYERESLMKTLLHRYPNADKDSQSPAPTFASSSAQAAASDAISSAPIPPPTSAFRLTVREQLRITKPSAAEAVAITALNTLESKASASTPSRSALLSGSFLNDSRKRGRDDGQGEEKVDSGSDAELDPQGGLRADSDYPDLGSEKSAASPSLSS